MSARLPFTPRQLDSIVAERSRRRFVGQIDQLFAAADAEMEYRATDPDLSQQQRSATRPPADTPDTPRTK